MSTPPKTTGNEELLALLDKIVKAYDAMNAAEGTPKIETAHELLSYMIDKARKFLPRQANS